jgi:serine/threonine-protein kinase RsbW
MYEKDTFPGGHRIRFSSSLDLLDRAVAETVAFVTSRNASGNLFDVKLLLREALLNAVLHGNRSDPQCAVVLAATASDGRLTLDVADQGPGFDWRERLANPPNPEDTSGRGLTILTLYADDVRFNTTGNRVTLTKTIPGLRGPAMDRGQAGEDNPVRRSTMDDIRIEDDRTVYCPTGDIVASMAEDMRARLRDVMREHPGPLTIDLSRVELIDSVGIGLLIAAHNTLAKSGQRLALEHVNPDLAGLLRTMRLDKHFVIAPA